MELGPQQVEQDVLIGPCKPSPSDLKMTSRRDGLLKDLVVLGHVPIMEVIIWVSFIKTEDTNYQKG